MKNIFITHAYFLRLDPKQWITGRPYPPLGTLYAAAVLQKQNYELDFYDVMFNSDTRQVKSAITQKQPEIFIIYDDGFNYLTKMCLTNMRKAAFEMIAHAKLHGCTVIISSSDSTDQYEQYLDAGADFVLLGEGEETLAELVNELNAPNCEPSHIDGIVYRTDQSLIKNKKRELIRDLDSIPFPAWELLDIEPYRRSWLRHAGYFSINMATTRGCPFKCNWCAKPIYGNRYHSRSPQNVVKEIQYLKQRFGFDHIWFCDDIFGLKPGWIEQFACELADHNLQIRFKIQARADLLVTPGTIEALSHAGCKTVWMGAESGSQKVLDAMDKGITTAQIAMATKKLRESSIEPCFFIQFGYPGETRKDIELTIKMINTLLPHELGISVSYPLPGTLFFEKVKAELQLKSHWTDSDELALMFSNTYQPAFYKVLHRYVHKTYRKQIGLQSFKNIFRQPSAASFHSIKKAASLLYYIPAAFINKIRLNKFEHGSLSWNK